MRNTKSLWLHRQKFQHQPLLPPTDMHRICAAIAQRETSPVRSPNAGHFFRQERGPYRASIAPNNNAISEDVKSAVFQSSPRRGMLNHGFSSIAQSGSRGLRDCCSGCGPVGHSGGRRAAVYGRYDGHVDVRRHAVLPRRSKKQGLPRLSARRDVRPEDGSGRPIDNGSYAAAPSGPNGAFSSQ